jgi:hypothetical protein
MKIEKYMIELTILEAAENIKKEIPKRNQSMERQKDSQERYQSW